jgi:predicted RNase H-like HicB family nuclease
MSKLELIFEVEQEADGGYVAAALGEGIVTEADDLEALRLNVREAVHCHFAGRADPPRVIRLHFVHEEVLAL